MIRKYLISSDATATQLEEVREFLKKAYGDEFAKLSWFEQTRVTIDFMSIRKQKLQENRYIFQLLMGPVPILIALLGWLLATWRS